MALEVSVFGVSVIASERLMGVALPNRYRPFSAYDAAADDTRCDEGCYELRVCLHALVTFVIVGSTACSGGTSAPKLSPTRITEAALASTFIKDAGSWPGMGGTHR